MILLIIFSLLLALVLIVYATIHLWKNGAWYILSENEKSSAAGDKSRLSVAKTTRIFT